MISPKAIKTADIYKGILLRPYPYLNTKGIIIELDKMLGNILTKKLLTLINLIANNPINVAKEPKTTSRIIPPPIMFDIKQARVIE